MAYNVPDADGYTYKPRSAQANTFVAGYAAEGALELEDRARADAANVTSVDKIDYAAALQNYESRPDAELFANRRAREYADDFAAQDFARVEVDIAGPHQPSTIGTTSVVAGTVDTTDENAAVDYQPVSPTFEDLDLDGDGLLAGADPDNDGDGKTDAAELAATPPTDPNNAAS